MRPCYPPPDPSVDRTVYQPLPCVLPPALARPVSPGRVGTRPTFTFSSSDSDKNLETSANNQTHAFSKDRDILEIHGSLGSKSDKIIPDPDLYVCGSGSNLVQNLPVPDLGKVIIILKYIITVNLPGAKQNAHFTQKQKFFALGSNMIMD